jgi:hypothetical protein
MHVSHHTVVVCVTLDNQYYLAWEEGGGTNLENYLFEASVQYIPEADTSNWIIR